MPRPTVTTSGCFCCGGTTGTGTGTVPSGCVCAGADAIPDTIRFTPLVDIGFLAAFVCRTLTKTSPGTWTLSADGIDYSFRCPGDAGAPFSFIAIGPDYYIFLSDVSSYRCNPLCIQGPFQRSGTGETQPGVIGIVPPCIDPGTVINLTLYSEDPAIDGTSVAMTPDGTGVPGWNYTVTICNGAAASIVINFFWGGCVWTVGVSCQGDNATPGCIAYDFGVDPGITDVHSSGTFIHVDIAAHPNPACPDDGPCCVNAFDITN